MKMARGNVNSELQSNRQRIDQNLMSS